MPRRIRIPRNKLLSQLFKKSQRIPYQICGFDNSNYHLKEVVNTGMEYGDGRHKSLLLYNLLQQNTFDAEHIKVVFDWKDLPIPEEILGILKKSGTRWIHDILWVRINDNFGVHVDPSWNLELKKKGFPVTEDWDGESHTKQITEGKLEFYKSDEWEAYKKKYPFNIDNEEVTEFIEALNKWLLK